MVVQTFGFKTLYGAPLEPVQGEKALAQVVTPSSAESDSNRTAW